jgi:hypothetical protein
MKRRQPPKKRQKIRRELMLSMRARAIGLEHTRDFKKFNILFDENMTYGARRNLLGLKTYALTLNVVVVIICLGIILLGPPLSLDGTTRHRLIIVLIVTAIHAGCVLAFVNEQGVFQAARQYSRQLLLSCETLANLKKPTTVTRARSKKK